ncbi:MAG: DUF1016 N-terminal domain-containing protein [Candidatus Eremiobacterota bacterium]
MANSKENLSWSHYRLLTRVTLEEARSFYVAECSKAGWSVRPGRWARTRIPR